MMQFKSPPVVAKGFVLLTSLLMVFAITAIALALLSNSSLDSKMVTAAEQRELALQLARGANDQLYADAVQRRIDGKNYFAAFSSQQQAVEFESDNGVVSTLSWASEQRVETDCPRSKTPTEGLRCHYLQAVSRQPILVNSNYQLQVVSGVAQQVGVK